MMDKHTRMSIAALVTYKNFSSMDMTMLENIDDVEMKKFKIEEGEILTRAEKRRIKNNTTTLKSVLSRPNPKVGKYEFMDKPDRTGFISKFQRSNRHDNSKIKNRHK